MSSGADPVTVTLCRLGFTELEAEIYAQLLRHQGSTGYAVAKAIRRPHANVYQALATLERKGAVFYEDEPSRVYSAVPPADLFAQLRRRFDAECAAAEEAFAEVEAQEPGEQGLYRLSTSEQVIGRARAMIEAAGECVVIYANPEIMPDLRPALEAAVARGVAVAGLMLRDEDLIPGSRLRMSRVASRVTRTWRVTPLLLAVDASELLLAQFSPGDVEVHEAVWTRSGFLASLFHNTIVSDTILHSLPAIEEIMSPNRFLLGELPSRIRAMTEKPGAGR